MKPKVLFGILAASLHFSATSTADTFYWDGADNGDWNLDTNWSTDLAGTTNPTAGDFPNDPTDIAIFNASTVTDPRTVNLKGNWQLSGLEFNTPGTVTLQGGTANRILELGAGGITAGTGTRTLNIGNTAANEAVEISLKAAQTWAFNSTVASAQSAWGIQVKNNVSLGIATASTLTIGGSQNSSTPQNSISGVISNGSATLSLELKGGSNTRWTLSGNNTYTGATTVTNGGLTVGHVNALGSTSTGTTVASGASIFMRTTIGSIAAEAISITGTGAGSSGALRNVGGANTWNGAITLTGSAYIGSDAGTGNLLTLSNTAGIGRSGTGARLVTFFGGGAMDVQGAITDDIAVTRGSGGTTTLSGTTKVYTGATIINDTGNLIVNTSLSGTSAVTVSGNLRGNGGSINTAAAVSVTSTGFVSLGTSSTIQDIGTLSMGALTLQNLASMSLSINSTAKTSDVLTVSSLTLNPGAVLGVHDLGSTDNIQLGDALLFIKTSGTRTGLFTFGGTLIEDKSTTFNVGANTFQIDYQYNGILGEGVALIAVIPEPSIYGLASLAALTAAFRRRR